MNTKEAIEILKREKYIVEQVGDKYRIKWPCDPDEPKWVQFRFGEKCVDVNNRLVTPRELIKWATAYTANYRGRTKFKSNVKFFDHRKNRRKTKQLLTHELYDNIPTKKAVYKENRWNWD